MRRTRKGMGIALGAATAWPTKTRATARTIDLQEKNILDEIWLGK